MNFRNILPRDNITGPVRYRHFRHPLWLLLALAFQAAFPIIMGIDYLTVRESLVSESHLYRALLELPLIIILLFIGAIAIRSWMKKRAIHIALYLLLVAVDIGAILFFMTNNYRLYDGVMQNESLTISYPFLYLYGATFLMPSIILSFLALMDRLTPQKTKYFWINFIVAVSAPLLLYLGYHTFHALEKIASHEFVDRDMLFSIALISGFVSFCFFAFRGFYMLWIARKDLSRVWRFLGTFLFALLFPLMGIIFNSHVPFDSGLVNFFGDFSNPAFLIVAALNGIFLLIPDPKKGSLRLGLFVLRSATLPFSLYFFIVFLPFIPIAFPMLIFFGAGILVLTPAVLAIYHGHRLAADYGNLRRRFRPSTLAAAAAGSFLFIPLLLILSFIHNRSVILQALDHLYYPDYTAETASFPDSGSIVHVLENISANNNRPAKYFTSGIPLISSLYNATVLEGKVLPYSVQRTMEQAYGDPSAASDSRESSAGSWRNSWNDPNNSEVIIRDAREETGESGDGYMVSRIHLELKNYGRDNGEFSLSFAIPEGTFVTGFYLYVNGEKREGTLAGKKSALWVYERALRRSRDPGLLYYEGNNLLRLRVFPFSSGEVRKAGFTLIHRDPVALDLKGHRLRLDTGVRNRSSLRSPSGSAVTISGEEAETLPTLHRRACYHFILDYSRDEKGDPQFFRESVRSFLKRMRNGEAEECGRVSYANFRMKSMDLKDYLQKSDDRSGGEIPFEGSLLLDRALRRIFIENLRSPDRLRFHPLPVVIRKDGNRRWMARSSLEDLRFAFPESDDFYEWTAGKRLLRHSLLSRNLESDKTGTVASKFEEYPVALWKEEAEEIPVRRDGKNKILYLIRKIETEDAKPGASAANEKAGLYEKALNLSALKLQRILAPRLEKSEPDLLHRESVKAEILTRDTSWIVLETEEQMEQLRRKEKESENIKIYYNSGSEDEAPRRMSEPGFLLAVLLLFLFHQWMEHRRDKKKPVRFD